jgi:hypothetical protein
LVYSSEKLGLIESEQAPRKRRLRNTLGNKVQKYGNELGRSGKLMRFEEQGVFVSRRLTTLSRAGISAAGRRGKRER